MARPKRFELLTPRFVVCSCHCRPAPRVDGCRRYAKFPLFPGEYVVSSIFVATSASRDFEFDPEVFEKSLPERPSDLPEL